MKKIVVMSDNHGDDQMMQYILNKEPHADYYIHCGDSEAYYPEQLSHFICVSGNNDWSLNLPQEAQLEVEGFKILITHGHRLGYFNREAAMNDLLTNRECQVLLCGHTHMPMFEKDGDYYYINPGSTSRPRGGSVRSYAVLTIDGKTLKCEFKEI